MFPCADASCSARSEEGRFVERYIIASWAEYIRLRSRMTVADRKLQDRVTQFQREDVPVRVSRLIGVSAREDDSAPHDAKTEPRASN